MNDEICVSCASFASFPLRTPSAATVDAFLKHESGEVARCVVSDVVVGLVQRIYWKCEEEERTQHQFTLSAVIVLG